MSIELTYGNHQRYRRRSRQITVRGHVDPEADDLTGASFRLNGGFERALYVEEIPDDGIDWVNGYKSSPAELRCKERGEFCVEIAADDPDLVAGGNRIALSVAGQILDFTLEWDPRPLPLPLDLSDLSGFAHVCDLGQTINGAFEIDHQANVIHSCAPVAPDAFLVLGSQGTSQEATYAVHFSDLAGAKWLGLSDFFVGLEEGVPPRGIGVGWSSAGMAALGPTGEARSFIAWGDHSASPDEWAVVCHPPAPVMIEAGVDYRVRHQLILHQGLDRVRFRIWPAGTVEPETWLCDECDTAVPPDRPRHEAASFGLFQHMGPSIAWSDIRLQAYQPGPDDIDPTGRAPFLGRQRPGSF
jgi:hypothetical protein